jgi:hypothetical protein
MLDSSLLATYRLGVRVQLMNFGAFKGLFNAHDRCLIKLDQNSLPSGFRPLDQRLMCPSLILKRR